MSNCPDIALLKLPNHNVDYPSISIPTLTRALREANCSVFQDDINVRLRNHLMTESNLKQLTYEFLPEAGACFLDNPVEYGRIKTIISFLVQLDDDFGFASIEATKDLMLSRKYEFVFNSYEHSTNCSSLFVVESIFHNIIDLSIKCEELAVTFLSKNIVSEYLLKKVDEIIKINPRVVGFSILDIQRSTSMWFAKQLRRSYTGEIVVGGPDVSIHKSAYLKRYPFIDVAFLQESEVSIVSYVKGASLDSISGIAYRNNESLVINEQNFDHSQANYYPDFSDFPLDNFLLPVLPVSASRGCAWAKCKFCVHHQTYSGYYERDPIDVADSIESLVNAYGVHHFHFTDDMLDVPLGTAIAKELYKRDLNVNILTYARFDKRFTSETLKKWQQGGIKVVEWGLESASPKMLNSMTKGISIEKVQEILDHSSKVGILNKLMLFHNYPGETLADFRQSLDFVEKNVLSRTIRPFFTIRNKLELRRNSELDTLSRNDDQMLFPKRWEPTNSFQCKIEYADTEDYVQKVDLLGKFLNRMQKLVEKRKVFSTNDENLTLDLLVWEMTSKNIPTKVFCK